MLEYLVEPGESVILRVQLADSSYTSLYPQTKIYNAAGTLVATVDLGHAVNALYTGSWTAGSEGKYYTQTIIYSDVDHLVVSDIFQPDSDSIDVSHYKFRPSFGGGGSVTQVSKLTDEDIEKIVSAVVARTIAKFTALLAPLSRFNPLKDKVKTEGMQVNELERAVIQRTNDLGSQISKIKPANNSDIQKALNKITKAINSIDLSINQLKAVEPLDLSDVNNSLSTILSTVNEQINSVKSAIGDIKPGDYSTDFSGISQAINDLRETLIEKILSVELGLCEVAERQPEAQSAVAELGQNLNQKIAIIGQTLGGLSGLQPEIAEQLKQLTSIALGVSELDNRLIAKDGLDDKRSRIILNQLKVIEKAIGQFGDYDEASLKGAMTVLSSLNLKEQGSEI
jgi:hypothetical protein